jgi:hypothetical protein
MLRFLIVLSVTWVEAAAAESSSNCDLDFEARGVNCLNFKTWSELNSLVETYLGSLLYRINVKSKMPLISTSELNFDHIIQNTISYNPLFKFYFTIFPDSFEWAHMFKGFDREK